MRWPGKGRRCDTGRRTATTSEELIRQIAEDKSIDRFAPRPQGVEAPRDVFMSVVDEVADRLAGEGWRHARSGPHMSRRRGDVSTRVAFVSNRLNVAGELVGLWVDIHLGDRALGRGRQESGDPLAAGDEVARRHLGHLLDPPQWLEWSLAPPGVRGAATTDIVETIEGAATRWVDSIRQVLDDGVPDPMVLTGHVSETSLIEYLVRAGRLDDAGGVVRGSVERSHERAQSFFTEQFDAFRRNGIPAERPVGGSALLANAAARFDLPVDRG